MKRVFTFFTLMIFVAGVSVLLVSDIFYSEFVLVVEEPVEYKETSNPFNLTFSLKLLDAKADLRAYKISKFKINLTDRMGGYIGKKEYGLENVEISDGDDVIRVTIPINLDEFKKLALYPDDKYSLEVRFTYRLGDAEFEERPKGGTLNYTY